MSRVHGGAGAPAEGARDSSGEGVPPIRRLLSHE